MLDFSLQFLQALWPVHVAAIVIALLGATELSSRPRRWWLVSGILSLAGILGVLRVNWATRDPTTTWYIMDVIGISAYCAGVPLLCAAIVAYGQRVGWRGVTRAGASALAALVLMLIGPWILLFVHCTSGDCL